MSLINNDNNYKLKKLLEDSLEKLNNNTSSPHETMLIIEFFIKNQLLHSTNLIQEPDKNLLKYVFMGMYIYDYIIPPDNDKNNDLEIYTKTD